jgi:predicted nucleic acid-binding protein
MSRFDPTVLVDTNVWIRFFRNVEGTHPLSLLIDEGKVATHSCVIGELCLSNLPERSVMIQYLKSLPQGPEIDTDEAIGLIETKGLFGKGLQLNDVLIFGTALIQKIPLWTENHRLLELATEYGIAWKGDPPPG